MEADDLTQARHDLAALQARYDADMARLEVELAGAMVVRQDAAAATLKANATFGGFDGIVSVSGIIFALLAKGNGAIIQGAVGLAAASTLGMGLGEYLSDARSGKREAVVMGLATAVGTLLPVVPFFVFSKGLALVVSGIVVLILAFFIGRQRAKGLIGYAQTYGILVGAAVATVLISLLIPSSAGG